VLGGNIATKYFKFPWMMIMRERERKRERDRERNNKLSVKMKEATLVKHKKSKTEQRTLWTMAFSSQMT
jgi:hypothetical protein